MSKIAQSELILNEDGSVYHLHLLPQDIANTVLLVGDPDRVEVVSSFFDEVHLRKQKREFHTHTGIYKGKKMSIVSTGIGTDNIDIVLNELDALVNIDLNTREIKSQHTALNIVRIGTSGALQSDIGIDHVLISEMAIGLDNLLHFYEHKNTSFEAEIKQAFEKHLSLKAYVAQASPSLLALFGACTKGITVTCSGFYAPQGRVLRANTLHKNFIHALHQFKHNEKRITNFEMETAGIYGLAKVLGHEALSVNAILANRITHQFSKQPDEVVKHTIQMVLDTLCDLK